MNSFVDAVGEQHLRCGEAEVFGDESLQGRALRIFRQLLAGDALQHLGDFGRWSFSVLVEVEAQAIASAEWRMILLHLANGFARLENLLHQASILTAMDCA